MELHPFWRINDGRTRRSESWSRNLCRLSYSRLHVPKQPEQEKKPHTTKIVSPSKIYHHLCMWGFLQSHRSTRYRSSLGVEMALVHIYEWTPTFAVDHLPSECSLTRDERESTDSQKHKNIDMNPRNHTRGIYQRTRHLCVLRQAIHVRSETEKII